MVANTEESLSFFVTTAFSITSPLAVVCFSNGVFFVPSNAANKSSGLNDSNSSSSSISDAFGAACECTLTCVVGEDDLASSFFSSSSSSSSSSSFSSSEEEEEAPTNPSFPFASRAIRSSFPGSIAFAFASLSIAALVASFRWCSLNIGPRMGRWVTPPFDDDDDDDDGIIIARLGRVIKVGDDDS